MDKYKQQFLLYWKIRWLRRSVISAISLAIVLLVIPVIIQFSITHLLVKQGASHADIEDINLNLFSGTFELKKLVITTADNQPIQLDHLDANLNMLDLFSSKIVLHEVRINGLDADIQLLQDGSFSINGLAVQNNTPTSDTQSTNNELEFTSADKEPVKFGISKLSIVNSNINYQESGFSHKNLINSLQLSNIKSWETSSVARLDMDAVLNEATFNLSVALTLFNETKHFKGHAALSSLAFSHYQKFHAKYLDSLQGNLKFESTFDISLSDTLTAQLENNIEVSELNLIYEKIHAELQKLVLNGKTNIKNIKLNNFLNSGEFTQDKILNLFSGNISLNQLAISSDKNKASQIKQISIDIDKLDALKKQFVLNEILIDGVNTNIERSENGEISINGLAIPASDSTHDKTRPIDESKTASASFGIKKLSLVNSDINYQETDFDQSNHIKSMIVTNIKSWDKGSVSTLDLDSSLNNAAFTMKANLQLFNDIKQFKGNASLSSLALSPYSKFYQQHIDSLQGEVSFDSEFDINLAGSLSIRSTNNIQLADLKLDYQDISQSIKKISWEGDTILSEKAELYAKGRLQINDSKTLDNKQKYSISTFDQLTIENLQKELETISFKQLNIKNLQLLNLQKDNRFVSLKEFNIHNATFNTEKSTLKVDQVNLDNPQIKVVISKNKAVSQLEPLLKTIDNLKPVAEEKSESIKKSKSTDKINIEITNLKLVNPGTLDFTDLSVSPNYKTKLNLNRVDINNLSSTNNAHFEIALKQAEYTTFDIKGDGLLLDPSKFMELSATIKQLDLPPVTPYTSNIMGYGMKSGVIDSEIKLKIKNRKIDSNIVLKVDSIEVVETHKKTAEEVSSASGMSIDLAISSLKDDKNVIDLKLPISGNLDKPDFDMSKIINKAMGKAMKSATLSYLKHSLQPFGSLITLYSLAKKAANHISLPPLLFNTNSLTFKDGQQDLLDKVIKVLSERPGLKIKTCGISALEDQTAIKNVLLDAEITRLTALNKETNKKAGKKLTASESMLIDRSKIEIAPELIQQKMKDLADNRSAKVKAFFLEKGELQSSRILNCLSATDTEEKSVPSVELLI